MTARAALRSLDATVTVAELQRTVIAEEAAAGWNVADARRPLSDQERKAGVRFGWLAERENTLAERLTAATDPIQAIIVDWLTDITSTLNPRQTVEVVAAAASPLSQWTPPGIDQVTQAVTAEVSRILMDAWTAGAADVLREADTQKATAPGVTVPMDAATSELIAGLAAQLIAARASRVLTAAVEAARTAL